MIKKYFRAHKFKIFVGAPILFLVLVNGTGIIGAGNVFLFESEKSAFLTTEEEGMVYLKVITKRPINALGGTIYFTPNLLRVNSLSRINSTVDLWTEEPELSNTLGTIKFSGGFLGEKTEAPSAGEVFTINFTALKAGKAQIKMNYGELLASDGVGTNVYSGSNVLTTYIREKNFPSPDVNGDGALSITDVNTLYIQTFRNYDKNYDINNDGRVSFTDVRALISLL